jgi:cation diffusion facilitator CzcD-associated flavoprotein CzcO
MDSTTFDVICIGAGISGVNAGYRIQESLPDSTYAILEARHEIGGTWSLFKYPGIRSDSDLHTFGFAFDPWKAGRSAHEKLIPPTYIYQKTPSRPPPPF